MLVAGVEEVFVAEVFVFLVVAVFLDIQPDIKVCATDSVEMSFKGIASGHRVKWSIQVRR